MSTATFIQIPGVGAVAAYSLDPHNRAHVSTIIRRADAYFKLSAKAWEEGNNSGNPATLTECEQEAIAYATSGETLLAPLGIKCSYPGLYPSFEVNGVHEYTTQNAVLTALGHNRNWLTS